MNREVLEKYLNSGKGMQIFGICIAVFGLMFSLAEIDQAGIGAMGIFVVLAGFGALLYVPSKKKQVEMKKFLDAAEAEGRIDLILADFQTAGSSFENKVRLGQQWVYGQKMDALIAYSEIVQVYQYVHRTNFVEDRRTLKAKLVSGKTVDVCTLPARGKGDQELKSVIMYMLMKNPNIKVGYK